MLLSVAVLNPLLGFERIFGSFPRAKRARPIAANDWLHALLKESVLQIWKARKAAVREELASAERAAKASQDKLDRLDEAFLFDRSIEVETYDRHAEKASLEPA